MTGLTRRRAAGLVAVVARREIFARLRDRAFLLSTGFLLLIIVGSVIVPLTIQGSKGRSVVNVVTVGDPAGAVARSAAAAADATAGAYPDTPRLSLHAAADAADAETLLRSGSADVALLPAGHGLELVATSEVPVDVAKLVDQSQAQQRLDSVLAGTSVAPADIARALTGTLPQRLLEPPSEQQDAVMLVGLVFGTLYFITTLVFGLAIAQSVVEEKQNRVVELLVAAIPVRVLLAGKVLGNTLLAVAQIVLLIGAGVAGATVGGRGALVSSVGSSSGWFLLFFLLGFSMIACLWAAAGSLSSRQEDLQATTLPLQFILMVPYFAALSVTRSGTWMTVLSYVPFTSPMVMPRRIAMGDARWWEPIASAGLVMLVGVGLVLLAARIYQGSLLRTGTRTSLRLAWSART